MLKFQKILFILILFAELLVNASSSKRGNVVKRTVAIPAIQNLKKSCGSSVSTWENSKPYYDPEQYHLICDFKKKRLLHTLRRKRDLENPKEDRMKIPQKVFEVDKVYAYEQTYDALHKFNVKQLLNCEIYLKGETTKIKEYKAERWYSALITDMLDYHRGLYHSTHNNSGILINPKSIDKEDYVKEFRFIGKMFALGIRKELLMPESVQLGRIFLKTILRRKIYLIDVEAADPKFYKKLMMVEKYPKKYVFSLDGIPLKENGARIRVTDASVNDYMDLAIEHKYVNNVSKQIKAFLDGFNLLIPLEMLNDFKPSDLEILLYGVPDYFDIEDWNDKTEVVHHPKHDYPDSLVKKFFKIIKDSYGRWDKIKLLYFIRGTTRFKVGSDGRFVGEKLFEIYANLDENGNRVNSKNKPLPLPKTNITLKRLYLLDAHIFDLKDKLDEAIENSEPF